MNDDTVDLILDIFNQGASAAPELGILFLFYRVRQNNILSGRNTAAPAPPVPVPTDSATQNAIASIVQGINEVEGAIPGNAYSKTTQSQVTRQIQNVANILGTDFNTALNAVKSALGL